MSYSLARQAEDGSWPYGEAANQQWIDSFHTGYNLLSLAQATRLTEREDFREGLRRGLRFFRLKTGFGMVSQFSFGSIQLSLRSINSSMTGI